MKKYDVVLTTFGTLSTDFVKSQSTAGFKRGVSAVAVIWTTNEPKPIHGGVGVQVLFVKNDVRSVKS